jgi:hypothetical protein
MSLRLKTKWVACAGIAGVLAVGVTGAIVSTASASGSSKVVSHKAASAVTTADLNFTLSVSGVAASPVTVTGSGEVDFGNDAASLTVTIPAALAQMIPGGSDSPETVNAVLSDGTVYLEVPSLASIVGEPWISVALPTKATTALPGGFTKVASALGDVNTIITFAQKHHATVTSLGTATVNTVQATGNQIAGSYTTKKGTTLTLTGSVWADASNHLVQGNLSVSGTGAKGPVGVTATVNLSGYGTPVTVTVPPSSEVKPVPYSVVAKFFGSFLGSRRHR